MRERIFLMVLVYTAVLVYGLLRRNKAAAPRDRLVYVILLVGSLYLSLDFIVNQDWPDTYDFVPGFIKELAKKIDSFLDVKM
ncbi:hypothetical protein OIN60_10060 [Paenibacillus sp. P96]|uniref:Histidine kinase n=1 Tax=Paenibacillus zeirhizosphaerae TaxID=2987519 RepID=A0ABT9FQU8_9BACL|nr:hypothetical protein [Paenibacillus sp. P96]MDP4097113.1 hypothetical protein [Paenibacillus sp. P96]